jgi:hypothetical protein
MSDSAIKVPNFPISLPPNGWRYPLVVNGQRRLDGTNLPHKLPENAQTTSRVHAVLGAFWVILGTPELYRAILTSNFENVTTGCKNQI